MSASEILERCWALGVRLVLVNGRLRARGSKEGVRELRGELKAHREELLEYLTPPELTTADVESFKSLRVELEFSHPQFGSFWLVPERTGQERLEFTPEDLVQFAELRREFPGSRWVQLERSEAL